MLVRTLEDTPQPPPVPVQPLPIYVLPTRLPHPHYSLPPTPRLESHLHHWRTRGGLGSRVSVNHFDFESKVQIKTLDPSSTDFLAGGLLHRLETGPRTGPDWDQRHQHPVQSVELLLWTEGPQTQ